MTITEFAKSRNQQAQTISRYMIRHNMPYDKKNGLTEQQLEELDQIYPIPNPTIVINGNSLDIEEERALRQELAEAQDRLNKSKDIIKYLTDKNHQLELEETKAQLMIEQSELKSRELQSELDKKNDELQAQSQNIDELKGEIDKKNDELQAKSQNIEELQSELDKLKNRGFWQRIFNKGV